MNQLPHVVTLKHSGKKGERVTIHHVPYCLFRVTEIHATDSLGGRGTKVGLVFVGSRTQIKDKAAFDHVSKGVFSADVSMRIFGLDRFDVCPNLVPIAFNVEFLEDAEFEVTLSGTALKEAGDTWESMRARTVDDYERAELDAWPEPRDPERFAKFEDMIRRMREAE